MKKILLILFFLALLPLARAQNVTTATVTITNTAGTVNGETFTLNGNTWTWTNDFSNPCAEIITGTNVFNSASNMWTSIISCPLPNMSVSYNTSNQFQFVSTPGAALTAVLSSGWGTLVYSTNTLTQATIVRVPPSVAGLYEQTNVSSGLATWLALPASTNTVPTNAVMFSPWFNWIYSLIGNGGGIAPTTLWMVTTNLPGYLMADNGTNTFRTFNGGSLTNLNGANIQSGTILTNSLSSVIYNLLFGGSTAVSGTFIPGLQIFYQSATNYPVGTFGTGYTNWVTTNQSLTAFGPPTINNSHAAPYLVWSRNYDGTPLASMDAEGIWQFAGANFGSLTIGGLPVGSGGSNGGTNSSGTNSSVQSLYYVLVQTSVNTFAISNVVISGTAGYLNAAGTYTNVPASGGFTFNYGGNTYIQWNDYGYNGNDFIWVPSSASFWFIQSHGGSAFYDNNLYSLIIPNFNSSWESLIANPATPTMTPVLTSLGNTSTTNSTITWSLGNNWYFQISNAPTFQLSLAQDWQATASSQVEYHKIFLNSNTNCLLSFGSSNQWTWQNRQGLAATAPTTISSNETITINLAHQGGQTNWLATWDTSAATNQSQVESGFVMTRSSVSADNTTNYYWWDFGQLNTSGQPMIYATLTATNTVDFIGLTNASIWRLLSFNVVASGSDRVILLPDSLPHLSTNNLTHSAPFYALTLTNGNEFRMTIQTNSTLSTTWATFGQ